MKNVFFLYLSCTGTCTHGCLCVYGCYAPACSVLLWVSRPQITTFLGGTWLYSYFGGLSAWDFTQIKWHGFKLRTILAVSWKGLEQLQTSFGSVSLLSPLKIAGGHTQSSEVSQSEPVASKIRQLFHVNSLPTFLRKLSSKKPKFNDVCVLFKHYNFYSRMLEMHSKRPSFQNYSLLGRTLGACKSDLWRKCFPHLPTRKLLPPT